MARELGYPFGQAFALNGLVIAAWYAGDLDDAAQLARQGGQIPDIPGTAARMCGYLLAGVLAEAGDLAAAEQACAATLAQARDAGDLYTLGELLPIMADLDLRAGRAGDAAAHLREAAQIALQTGMWFTILNVLSAAGTCAPPPGGRPTRSPHGPPAIRSASKAGSRQRTQSAAGKAPCAGPAGARPGPGPRGRQRGAAMSLTAAAEYALMLTAPDPPQPLAPPGRQAQRPGAGTGHPGRPGPHRRRHRRPAVHQHPHRPLPPGPDPGQDRLPPPRRPDPPGPQAGLV